MSKVDIIYAQLFSISTPRMAVLFELNGNKHFDRNKLSVSGVVGRFITSIKQLIWSNENKSPQIRLETVTTHDQPIY